jgi:hypothetical protein
MLPPTSASTYDNDAPLDLRKAVAPRREDAGHAGGAGAGYASSTNLEEIMPYLNQSLQDLGYPAPLELLLPNAGAGAYHSFTSQLNLSAFVGTGSARKGCVARDKGVPGGVQGV